MAEDLNLQENTPSSPVVIAGIGASAGGVEALQDFFSALPDKIGAAIVVIVHLNPDHESALAEVIAAKTRMQVRRVEGTLALEPDQVYVIPPNRQLTLSDTEISAIEFEEPRGQRTPIDHFFRSLARHGDGDGFAIILSGAGSDGALGVRAVKEAGGIILVQDPNDAEYGSMPRAAIGAGYADFVLPARELAFQFADLVQSRKSGIEKPPAEELDNLLTRVLGFLRVRTGHDFSQYKHASLLRRIDRRMQVVRSPGLPEYLDYLRENPDEVEALFADLLISVTRFFRDAAAFEQLKKIVVPAMLDNKKPRETVRIWVPGCATGEEAYSIAMIFLDALAQRDMPSPIQIFATDLDAGALQTAREGCYPETVSADVSEERLRRYFTKEAGEYRIRREVRDLIVFAQHSVVKDPPFSRLDLISCRNFLIYVNRELQQRVIATFHYALLSGGYLFLGSSETADHPEGFFRTVDRGARIFKSTGPRVGEPLTIPRLPADIRLPDPAAIPIPAERPRIADPQHQHRQALIELGPPSVLVDDAHRILHLSEKAGIYLLHPPGAPTLDITELVRVELAPELRAMLNRAFQLGESVLSLPIAVQLNGQSHNICLQVSPIGSATGPARALVLFIEGGPAQMTDHDSDEAKPDSDIQRLREELLATRANLKASRQQFEHANESQQAANEELQSINEEYRSTAEELETSREELQSMNEELQTLNAELKVKLDAASRAHNDLENLMNATNVGTLFLDSDLRIQLFTPRMRELFNINSSDEGRQIGDFTHRLEYPDFEQDARNVMERKTIIEKPVEAGGREFLMRLRPYQTFDGEIDGVVATFVDTSGPSGEQPQDGRARRSKTNRK
ncbi:MAG TPA: chemotaxis protein CheB [Micropepsaceae bacterium]|nr:chemotaxis protein CheB [Micropepsaceae bacterium]